MAAAFTGGDVALGGRSALVGMLPVVITRRRPLAARKPPHMLLPWVRPLREQGNSASGVET